MNITSRLIALERRQPPAPPTLTDAHRLTLADKLIADYGTTGRAGFIARWGRGLGAAWVTRVADRIEALATRAAQRREQP